MVVQGFPRDACDLPPFHDEFINAHTPGATLLFDLAQFEEETAVYMTKLACARSCARVLGWRWLLRTPCARLQDTGSHVAAERRGRRR